MTADEETISFESIQIILKEILCIKRVNFLSFVNDDSTLVRKLLLNRKHFRKPYLKKKISKRFENWKTFGLYRVGKTF